MSLLIGRDEELATLLAWSREGRGPFQVWGVAGVGKTHLLTALTQHTPSHWISLSQVRSMPQAIRLIADAWGLSVSETTPLALVEVLAPALERSPDVLILDDLDALSDRDALVHALRQIHAPLFWSSRRRHAPSIASLRVRPLPLEGARAFLARELSGLDTADTALTQLIQALDALPLALRLLVHKLRVLPANLLLRHLERRESLLGQGPLARALSMSVDTLRPLERRALLSCTVFHGGFEREAASAVLPPEEVDVLDDLVQASLLERAPDGRYAMLWSVHSVLNAPISPSRAIRHAEHYCDLMTSEPRHLLKREESNLLGACHRDLSPPLHARCVLAYWRLRASQGPYDELLCMVLDAIDRFASDTTDRGYIELLGRAGELHRVLGDFDAGVRYLTRGIEAFRDRQDDPLFGRLHMALSFTFTERHEYRAASRSAQVAQQCLLEHGDLEDWAGATLALAMAATHALDFDVAVTALLEVLARCPDSRTANNNLGTAYLLMGDGDNARRYLERAYELSVASSHHKSTAHACGNLIRLELFDRNIERAQALLEQQRGLYETLNLNHRRSQFEVNRAILFWACGELGDARATFELAWQHARQLKDPEMESAARARSLAVQLLLEGPSSALDTSALSPEDAAFVDAAHAISHFAKTPTQQLHDIARDRLSGAPRDIPSQVIWGQLQEHLERARVELLSARLTLEDQARWVTFAGVRYDMRRRTVSRRLLWALATRALLSPGVEIDADDLYLEGWPDEASSVNARQRLHTAIYRLREDLLGGALVTRGDGYLLDPNLDIEM